WKGVSLELRHAQQIMHEQFLPNEREVPVRLVLDLRERHLEAASDRLLDHLDRFALELLAALERERPQRIDHFALLIHHVVVLKESLARLEVLELDALLRLLDRARDERMREHLALLRA